MMVSGEPFLDVTPLRDLTPAWQCEKPDECMCGLLATSLFLIHINHDNPITWLEQYLFFLECNEVSSSEVWGVYG